MHYPCTRADVEFLLFSFFFFFLSQNYPNDILSWAKMACENVLDFALHLICMKLATCGLWQRLSLCGEEQRLLFKKNRKKDRQKEMPKMLKRNEKRAGSLSELSCQ